MKGLLYILYGVMFILIIGWVIAYFGFKVSGLLIPMLTSIVCVTVLIYGLIRTKKV